MSEPVLRAVFLDQVRVGQRIRLWHGDAEPWVVTGIRFEIRDGRSLVALTGLGDDGSPRYHTGASWCGALVYSELPALSEEEVGG